MKICFDVFLWPCIVLRETDMRPRHNTPSGHTRRFDELRARFGKIRAFIF